MTIILFLVDTSSSMCQKAYVNGVQKTYLDIAKGAVETFLKYRQRTQDCLGDRYMLLTFEEPPANVKAGWKENHATFMNELKNLQSHGLTSMGESLRNAFDLLNLNRMQSGIDTYGQGRCPFYLEPSVIIVITDGGRYSYRNGVHQEIILPLSNQIPGTKFTKEPFRWDQRLFSLVLRMPGNKIDERVEGKVPHDDSPIERMCEVTGGRSYRVRSHYVLNQCIESLVQKVQPGVVLQFEPLLPKDVSSAATGAGGGGTNGEPVPDIVFQPIKKMIYVQKHITQKTFPIGYWPLPEPYWPDSKAITLPPRDAHPKLKIIAPAVDEPQLLRNFPVDKYEVEACPLTLQILNKREMNKCWQVIVTNGMHGFELPFGYLKAAPNFSQVHLYVLAYNYPALLPLLHDLLHKYNMSPPNDLMYKFNAYVRSIPPYYCPFLRKALISISVPFQLLQFLLPDNVDNYLSPTIANQLKHIKNTAKQDQENLCMKVYKQLKQPKPPYRQVETAKLSTGTPLRRELVRHPLLRDTFAKLHAEIEPVENYTIVVPQLTHQGSAKSYRNPFDIPRRDLVEEIARMRETFLRPATLVAKDSGHCLPIAEMGNYQEYLKNKDNPLREIEPTNVRQHMFGNPYKKDKHMVMVDEADLSDVAPMKSPNGNGAGGGGGGVGGGVSGPGVGGMSGMGTGPGGVSGLMIGGASGAGGSAKKMDGTSRGRKRKAGPLPRAFEFRRLSTDTRPASPASSGSASGPDSGSTSYDEDSNSSYASTLCSEASSDSGMSLNTDRLSMGFDFGEEESGDQETALNGYVHNFINGISDDGGAGDVENPASCGAASSGTAAAATLAPTSTTGLALSAASNGSAGTSAAAEACALSAASSSSNNNNSSGVLYVPLNGLTTHAAYSSNLSATPPDSVGVGIGVMAANKPTSLPLVNGYSHHVNHFNMHASSAPATTPPTGGASSAALAMAATATGAASSNSAYFSHNDINDASEISRILQPCHNGAGSGSGSGSSAGSGSSGGGSSSTLNGDGATGADGEQASGVASSNSFDTLKREMGKLGAAASVATPHFYWASGLNHHSSNNNSNNNFNSSGTGGGGNNSNNSAYNNNHLNSYSANNNNSSGGTGSGSGGNNNNSSANCFRGDGKTSPNYSSNNNSNNNNNNVIIYPLTEEQREAARKHNTDLRMQIFRDIRRPGRDYSQLLEHLNLIKGDHEMKADFIDMCIGESLRFRRQQMMRSIKDWWERKQRQLESTKS